MDDILKRILSLVPDEHGGRTEFARKLGYKDGSIINHWIAGTNKSYLSKIDEIALLYNVSPEWLRGEDESKLRAMLYKMDAAELLDIMQIAADLLNKKIDRSK